MLKILALATPVLVLAGCAANPTTPEAFRDASRGGHMLAKKPESFIVDRPLVVVATAFQRRAPECLDYNLYTQKLGVIGNANQPNFTGSSKSTVITGPKKAELYLQVHYRGNLANEPGGGAYVFIADAEAVGPGKTRVDIYRAALRTDVIYEAVRGWATGTTQGCPDPKSYLG